jgi:hypothetical protein
MKAIVSLTCLAAVLTFASLASADPVGGPSGGTTRVQAYSTNVHKVLYRGGEQADFMIVGDGDTTLNVVVRDGNGNVVFRTTGPGDRFNVSWRPSQTGFFYISVVNQGNVYNQYSYRAY